MGLIYVFYQIWALLLVVCVTVEVCLGLEWNWSMDCGFGLVLL